MNRTFPMAFAVALAACMVWCCGSAFASRPHQNCSDPSVFPGANVNIVVLPYVSTGATNSSLTDIGQRLALLVKLDAFAHVLDYGSMGATQMEVPRGAEPDTWAPPNTSALPIECVPQVVIPKLLGQAPGASIITDPGKGLVIVWGVLYEEEDDIVIQSYVRFLRRDTRESINFRISDFGFSAQPSSQVIAFQPRSLKKSLLDEVEASYRRVDFVHKEPRDDSEGEPLPRPVAKCISCEGELAPGYQVQERRGEWIHVRWIDPQTHSQRGGWIHASTTLAGRSLDHTLPELHFIQGCVGYLMQRVVSGRRKQLSKSLAAQAVGELQQFVVANGSSDKTANAVALELAGMIELLQGKDNFENNVAARKNFDAALALVPFDAEAVTLASVMQTELEWKFKHTIPMPAVMADRLTNAAAVSADPKGALANVRSYLQLLLSLPSSVQLEGLSRAAIQQRLEAVEKVRVPSS